MINLLEGGDFITEGKSEKAVLVGIEIPGNHLMNTEASLEELAELAKTAGADVLDKLIQKRTRPDSAYYMGKGFAEELGLRVQGLKANLIIVDEELSGTQIRNLEETTGVRVIDRTTLILDIFAQRAKSREGKLQVELAQLNYRLPRLTGLGLQLSRLAGGIGTRGPGETKLETDRRHLKNRINDIKKQIARVSQQRRIKSQSRNPNTPFIVLIGYTNAGKSSIRYRLLREVPAVGQNISNEDQGTDKLFATLDPTIRGIRLNNGREILIGDTVGFIQKIPHQLVTAFKTTLDEVLDADLLLHVVDISNPFVKEQQEAVYKVLEEIGAVKIKRITIYNKIDLVDLKVLPKPPDQSPYLAFSAKTGQGLNDLLDLIEKELPEKKVIIKILLPFSQGKIVSDIHNNCSIIETRYTPEGIYFKLEVPFYFYPAIKKFLAKESIIQNFPE
ncbi:GTPase HflX [Desulfitibacter alkalitolerans]|uniref:GTPase HflX n=1 Tax=Desulfitibacter alkalitolerans TaxID=264641 RepID=UPI000A077A4E|nr:GTPase HflX [Desulfitibacter alkalitolerans]